MNWDHRLEPDLDEQAERIGEAVDELNDLRIIDLAKDRLPATYAAMVNKLRDSLKELFIYENEFPTE